jgi:hypothetical protein
MGFATLVMNDDLLKSVTLRIMGYSRHLAQSWRIHIRLYGQKSDTLVSTVLPHPFCGQRLQFKNC